MTMNTIRLRVRAFHVLVFGIVLTAVMIIVDLGAFYALYRRNTSVTGLIERIDVGADASVPTWVAATALFACAIAAFVLYRASSTTDPDNRRHWLGISVILFIFSVDEVARLHEWMDDISAFQNQSGLLYYGWVIGGAALVVIVAVAYLPFAFRLDRRTRTLLIVSAVTFVGGALVIEMLNARVADQIGEGTFRYAFQTAVEEGFEFLGTFGVLYAMLDLIDRRGISLHLACDDEPAPTSS